MCTSDDMDVRRLTLRQVGVTEWGLKKCKKVQEDYNEESWSGLVPHFLQWKKGQAITEDKSATKGTDGNGVHGDRSQVPHWTD